MSNLMEGLFSQLGKTAINSLSSSLGADDSQVQTATGMAVPLLMKALSNNAQDSAGAEALSNALDKDHQGSLLDNLGDVLGKEQLASAGSGILKHVLGDKIAPAAAMIAKTSGLSQGNAVSLITQLAPVVMGFLGKQKQEQNLNASSLASLLSNVSKEASDKAPQEMGIVGKLLDRDGDGDITDDLMNMGGSLLKNFLK